MLSLTKWDPYLFIAFVTASHLYPCLIYVGIFWRACRISVNILFLFLCPKHAQPNNLGALPLHWCNSCHTIVSYCICYCQSLLSLSFYVGIFWRACRISVNILFLFLCPKHAQPNNLGTLPLHWCNSCHTIVSYCVCYCQSLISLSNLCGQCLEPTLRMVFHLGLYTCRLKTCLQMLD